MRILHCLGGVSLTVLLALGGCSSDDESTPAGVGGTPDAGQDANVSFGGSGGKKADGGAGGQTTARGGAGGSQVDAGLDVSTVDSGTGGVNQTDAQPDVVTNPPADGSTGGADANVDRDSGLNDAKADTNPGQTDGSVDVFVPSDTGVDAQPGVCKLSASGAGSCEAMVGFRSATYEQDLGTVHVEMTSCPDGPNGEICSARGNLGNVTWTRSNSSPATLEGTVGLRAQDIVANVKLSFSGVSLGSATCHLSIEQTGGSNFTPIPVRITLPQGTSATDFIPGCTSVSGPTIALRGTVPWKVTGTGCATLESIVGQNGLAPLVATLNDNVIALIKEALERQVCMGSL